MSEKVQAVLAEMDSADTKQPEVKVDAPVVDEVKDVPEPATQGNDADTDDKSGDTEDTAASDGDDAPAQRKKNKGVGKRIDELTREKYEERRAREALERELADLRAKYEQKAPEQKAQASSDRPKLEDFDFDQDAHAEAVAEWKFRKMQDEQRQTDAKRQSQEAFESRRAAIDPEDWNRAITAPINYTPAMLAVIQEADMGPQVAVYLADHLDEADKISRMSDFHAAAALGRIEAKLSAPQTSVPPPSPPKTVTKAPAPGKTLQGTGTATKGAHEKGVEDFLSDIRSKAR